MISSYSLYSSHSQRVSYVIGIDEVGRGPLAGPVTVCAFAIPCSIYMNRYRGLRRALGDESFRFIKDSKKLSPENRQMIEKKLRDFVETRKSKEVFFSIQNKSAKHIDKYGISESIADCIDLALMQLEKQLKIDAKKILVLLDGALKAPPRFINQKTIIKGDDKEKVISCASILAKVYRDTYMSKLARRNPQLACFNFEIHKGYGTKAHRDAIRKNGISEIHRKSFCHF